MWAESARGQRGERTKNQVSACRMFQNLRGALSVMHGSQSKWTLTSQGCSSCEAGNLALEFPVAVRGPVLITCGEGSVRRSRENGRSQICHGSLPSTHSNIGELRATRRIVVVGIHGSTIMRRLLGEPTGTCQDWCILCTSLQFPS